MRSPGCSGSFRLSFLIPKGITAKPGEYANWVPGCVVNVDRVGWFSDGSSKGPRPAEVEIFAPSKEQAFEQAARVLRVICQGKGALSITALLESPRPVPGRDSWTIIVGADIAFSPTALGAIFPVETAAATEMERV